jgi:energy-coupling factor transporter ATP-binding protein EcfA2
MRIVQIDLQNFRAFRHTHQIKLDSTGKNLILYGENGSGKSSFFLALKQFLYSSLTHASINDYRNIFTPDDEASIRFHVTNPKKLDESPSIYEWSTSNPTGHHAQIIREAATASGFLDYRCLLETHFLTPASDRVNIFHILINILFANIRNDITKNTFDQDWKTIQNSIPKRSSEAQSKYIATEIDNFNAGLINKLLDLKGKLIDIFGSFGYYDVSLDFDFAGLVYNRQHKKIDRQEVILKVQFFSQAIDYHHKFLNEAKLSAIGLSIYLAALRLNPMSRPDRFKILVLDDVLIGLDMSNRLPIIKILQNFFSDYQIFLLTHDLEWFEILKQRLNQEQWKPIELYCTKDIEYEIPIFADNKDYLNKADAYLKAHDYKAAAIYLRTAFEIILKRFCNRTGVPVKYKEKVKELSSEDFWTVVKPQISQSLVAEVEQTRSLIMNPLSHARIITVYPAEVKDAIVIIQKLQQELEKL